MNGMHNLRLAMPGEGGEAVWRAVVDMVVSRGGGGSGDDEQRAGSAAAVLLASDLFAVWEALPEPRPSGWLPHNVKGNVILCCAMFYFYFCGQKSHGISIC